MIIVDICFFNDNHPQISFYQCDRQSARVEIQTGGSIATPTISALGRGGLVRGRDNKVNFPGCTG